MWWAESANSSQNVLERDFLAFPPMGKDPISGDIFAEKFLEDEGSSI
tara:strand:+ start:354 stop:494 length:141 start_codon:yes stop_codon:yes gene_type:complete